MSLAEAADPAALAAFRRDFHACLDRRASALFELTDALLCADGPVTSLPELSLMPEHRRGHGALYDGLACGQIAVNRLRLTLAGLELPRDAQGRTTLAVDVSPWLRPDAPTSDDRMFCHVYGRGKNSAQMIPGWPYSMVAALETGRSSWTQILDAQRLGPYDDPTETTATQLRELVTRLREAGQHRDTDPDILVVFDAGYDTTRLTHLLADLPVELLGRVRCDRVFCFPAPPRSPGATGRPSRHGEPFDLDRADQPPAPAVTTSSDTSRYGTATVHAWHRLHPRLTRRAAWKHHHGELPIIEGTLIRLTVDRLPGDRNPKPLWLWSSHSNTAAAHVDRLWRAFLRRFDIEHTFRFLKQTLGWTRPRIRTADQADRWTWLIITAHTQLRLARSLAEDQRRPWEKPAAEPRKLTPARVRRGFRNIRPTTALPASAPKPSHPGPGRPPGIKNKRRAPHHNVGKQIKTPTSTTEPG